MNAMKLYLICPTCGLSSGRNQNNDWGRRSQTVPIVFQGVGLTCFSVWQSPEHSMLKTQAFFRMYLCSQFPRLFVVVLNGISFVCLFENSGNFQHLWSVWSLLESFLSSWFTFQLFSGWVPDFAWNYLLITNCFLSQKMELVCWTQMF